MPIVGKYFPSQKPQEKVFLLLRRHWFTYVGFLAIAIFMSIPLIFLIIEWIGNPDIFSGSYGNLAILGIFAYSLFVVGLILYGFIDYYLDVYIITNERIVNIEQNGFFRREISELHLHQIQDVSAKVNGFLPTIIHYGDTFIQTAGERENFVFKSIPNPYRVSKLIVDLHEAQLERGGESVEFAEEEAADSFRDKQTKDSKSALDLESVSPESLSLARKRTKDFLKGGALEETELKTQVENGLSAQKYENILEGVDESKRESTNLKPESKTIDEVNPVSKVSTRTDKRPLEIEGQNNSDEGELKENEEVDL